MQLTKLRAAPVWQAEVPPCAPAGEMDGGTASQLIRGVRQTGASALWARQKSQTPSTQGPPRTSGDGVRYCLARNASLARNRGLRSSVDGVPARSGGHRLAEERRRRSEGMERRQALLGNVAEHSLFW